MPPKASSPDNRVVIRIENLEKGYRRGKVKAVDRVSFEVRQGQVFGLVGPDGAGKTSILQILAGVLSCDGGSAEVGGINALARPEAVKELIGFMPQGIGLNLYDTLTVDENIGFFRELRRIPEAQYRENRDLLLEMTRLAPFLDRPAGKLSGGMRQKLALICTLIHLPQILLLDEPTTGVDPLSRRDFWTIIQNMVAQRGITVLLTTAYMDEAERCRQVAMMHEGRIIASGPPEDLTHELAGRLLEVDGAEPLHVLAALSGRSEVESASAFGRSVHVLLREDADGDPATLLEVAGLRDVHIHKVAPSLEDVFMHRLTSATMGPPPRAALTPRAERHDGPTIITSKLTCRFDHFTAVDAVDLAIGSGEVFGLLGPNGAGKTTLIRMLCGLQRPTEGSASISGLDIVRQRRTLKGRIGYMSQRFSLYRDLKVSANLKLYGGLYGLTRDRLRRRANDLLQQLDLAGYAERQTRSLPLGLRQRLALACALLHEPDVLFLDEPTSGVDPLMRRRFWDLVHGLAADGVSVLVSTHYMDEAEHCHRLGFMQQGKLVVVGSPAALKEEAQRCAGPEVSILARDFNRAFQLLGEAFPAATLYGRRIQWQTRLPQEDISRARQLLQDAGVEAELGEQPLSMEETFVSFMEAGHRV